MRTTLPQPLFLALFLALLAACSEPVPLLEATCDEGMLHCGEGCVDVTSNPLSCGACGNVCAADQLCAAGACVDRCPAGQSACDGACRDLSADRDHCGGCGLACEAGEECVGGACTPRCEVDQIECDGLCVRPSTDPAHCGGCGNACDEWEACADGSCVLDCGADETRCGGSCVDTGTDPDHCGGCGNACGPGLACVAGQCTGACGAGELLCAEGCVDPRTDDENCGACGNACPAGISCHEGVCPPPCPAGEIRCDGTCVDPLRDGDHCGGCGNVCGAGQVCAAGTCNDSCGPGLIRCGDACIDPISDPENCGGCQIRCSAPGATCNGGSCSRVVFVTSSTHDADFGGLEGADAFCQSHADAAGLPGQYLAWLSDSTGTPSSRFKLSDTPYRLVGGTLVAENWESLASGRLIHPIDRTELGLDPPLAYYEVEQGFAWEDPVVHSNTKLSGDGTTGPYGADACRDYTSSGSGTVYTGSWRETDGRWTRGWAFEDLDSPTMCSMQAPLYCFEQ